MKKVLTFLCLILTLNLVAQVNFTAKDGITPYTGQFRPGANLDYFPAWNTSQLGALAAGDPNLGVMGVGAKVVRPVMPESVLEIFGYDILIDEFEYWQTLGMSDFTATLTGPVDWHRDYTEYCPGTPSALFANLYEPIWDGGANGTPYNEENYFAAYVYKTVSTYDQYVNYWEIWNEPGFDLTGNKGWRDPGDPQGNWWDNDPDPCDYILNAPIEHYVRTIRIAYEVIKTINPNDYVMIAGLGYQSFLDAILRNTDNPNGGTPTTEYPEGGGAYFEIQGLHSYPHFDGTTTNNSANFFQRHSDRAAQGLIYRRDFYQQTLGQHGYDGITYDRKLTMATEMNVPREFNGGDTYFASTIGQRNYIMKSFVTAMLNNVIQFHVFGMSDNPGAGFGFDVMGLYQNLELVSPFNQVPNPEAIAMKTSSDMLFGNTYNAARTAQMNLPQGVKGYAFQKPDGKYVYMLWAETTIDLSEFAQKSYTFPGSLPINELYRVNWDYASTQQFNQVGTQSTVQLNATPVFFLDHEPGGNSGNPCDTQGGDSDGDGICNNQDNCPNVANPNQADSNNNGIGDACEQTGVDCNDINIEVGNGNITISGLTAPVDKVQVFDANWQTFYDCTSNCHETEIIPAPNGVYNIIVSFFDTSWQPICQAQDQVTVGGGGNPCDTQGGDSDGDGICNNQDNCPNVANPNQADSNNNGIGDACEQTGVDCNDINIEVGNGNITISGLTAPVDKVQVFDANWQTFYVCTGNCNETEIIPAPNGIYNIIVSFFDSSWQPICQAHEQVTLGGGGNPCDTQGGDSDGDGICDNQDNCPNVANPSQADSNNNGIGDVCEQIGGDCNDINIEVGNGNITISGLTASVDKVQVFDANWQTFYVCTGTCNNTEIIPASNGVYNIIVSFFNSNWQPICQVQDQVTVGGGGNPVGGNLPTGYCVAKGNKPWQEWISNVSFANINHDSGKDKYGDFKTVSTNVILGQTYGISVQPKFSWQQWNEYVRVWIDYNRDGDFQDAGEMVFSQIRNGGASGSSVALVTGSITIPSNASPGPTVMRVAMKQGLYANSCETFELGEVEDYRLDIISSSPTLAINQGEEIFIFNAYKQDRQVVLNWLSNQSLKTDFYQIERSVDGSNFEVIAAVTDIADTDFVINYQALDEQPAYGINLYRIKTMLSDGTYQLSTPQSIIFDIDKNTLVVYPNPAQHQLFITLNSFLGQSAEIQIFNNLGQIMLSETIKEISEGNIRLNVADFKNGLYNLTIKIDDLRPVSQKIVINKL